MVPLGDSERIQYTQYTTSNTLSGYFLMTFIISFFLSFLSPNPLHNGRATVFTYREKEKGTFYPVNFLMLEHTLLAQPIATLPLKW